MSLGSTARNLMVSTHQVEFGKDSTTMEIRCEVLNVGDRVIVWYCAIVQGSVVAAWTPVSWCFLGHH